MSKALGVEYQLDQAFIVLGIARDGFLQGTLSDLHVILWKFVIIQMVAVDESSQKYVSAEVWKSAVRRQRSRLEAHAGSEFSSRRYAKALPPAHNSTRGVVDSPGTPARRWL